MNSNPKILVADDEQDIVEILSYNFSKQNFNVIRAYGGRECVSLARQFSPDIIIMDIRMPEMNGIEACRIIKHDDALKKIKVLFLTADTDAYTAMSARNAGGDQLITKPTRISLLIEIVKSMIDPIVN